MEAVHRTNPNPLAKANTNPQSYRRYHRSQQYA